LGDVLPHKLKSFSGSSTSVGGNSPVHAAATLVLLTGGSYSSQKVSQNLPDTFSPCFTPICFMAFCFNALWKIYITSWFACTRSIYGFMPYGWLHSITL